MQNDYELKQKIFYFNSKFNEFKFIDSNSEDEFVKLVKEAFQYAFNNFQEPMPSYRAGYYAYNNIVNDFCNFILKSMDKNPELLKSDKLLDYFFNLLLSDDAKYINSKDFFIFILLKAKDKKRVSFIAQNVPSIWKDTLFTQFAITEAVYKLKIPGFVNQIKEMKKIAENDQDKKMLNFTNRYLENQYKYK